MGFLKGFGLPELLIILVIVLLIFGATKVPNIARSLGKSINEFKAGVKEGDPKDKTATTATDAKASTNGSPGATPRD